MISIDSPRPVSRFGERTVGANHPVFVIAEIGTSHQGERDHAFRLIDAAKEAGADCAKFQIVYADEIIHPNTGSVPLPGGETPLFERFRSLEREVRFYEELKAHTEAAGLMFLCSVFGLRSAREARSMNPSAIKIASPELNHLPLLKEAAGYRLPLILSSGVSMLSDIERALGLLEGLEATLLHCVTSYPAPITDYNLRVMRNLERIFGVPVGVSDHSLSPTIVPSLAAALGAAAIEKHLTLSNEGGGLDDPVALAPMAFAEMVAAAREARDAGIEATVEHLAKSIDRDELQAVLGSGKKELAGSERESYTRTNRSLHAVVEIPKGTLLTERNVAVLRTEKKLRPGLSPFLLPEVLGRRTTRTIPSGEGIVWEDLLSV